MWAGERGAESSVIHHGSGRRTGFLGHSLALESRRKAQAPRFSSWRMTQHRRIPPGNHDLWGGGSRKGSGKKGAGSGEPPHCGRAGLSIPALGAAVHGDGAELFRVTT